jgi:hypothetical protein
MAADYIISLKRPSYRAINLVSVILLLLFLVAFLYFLNRTGIDGRNGWLLLIPAMVTGLMIYGFTQRKRKDFLVYYRTELFIAAIGWFMLPLYAGSRYFGWAYALMALIERFVKYPDEWVFSKENIIHPGLPKKEYEWVEIDNVLIRDNIFTLDFINNKVIQKELDQPVEKSLEEEFNSWCQQQLHFKSTNGQPGTTT